MPSKEYLFWFFGITLLFGIFFMPIQSNSSEYLRSSSLIPQNSASSPRIIEFSDYQWFVRSSKSQLQDPGPNLFFDDNHSIRVDQNGHLHLTIRSINNSWYASEISSILSFGHGTYEFTLNSDFESLDQNIVLGLFTYLDDLHEIYIEYARWGDPFNNIGQFVVQPYYNSGKIYRFNWSVTNTSSFHRFRWNSKSISFTAGIRNYSAYKAYSNWM